jgi:hypothetical protein
MSSKLYVLFFSRWRPSWLTDARATQGTFTFPDDGVLQAFLGLSRPNQQVTQFTRTIPDWYWCWQFYFYYLITRHPHRSTIWDLVLE